jgi:hypothetical protein
MMTTRTPCGRLGLELPVVNGTLAFAGLSAISRRATANPAIAAA